MAGHATISAVSDAVRADLRARLLDLLDEVPGRKELLLDSTIAGPLDLIVSTSDLKDHGVQNWYKLTDQVVTSDCKQMMFLVRCTRVELVDMIAAQILEDDKQGKDRMYVVAFLPQKTEQCIERLGRSNVRANVRIAECALHFFPFDRDVLSMQVPGVFHDYHVVGDPSGAFYTAKALNALQSKFGPIPSVHAIGGAGKTVVDIMLRLRKEELMSEALKDPRPARELSQKGVPPVAAQGMARYKDEPGPGPKAAQGQRQPSTPLISEVVIIDRRVDIFSVLCSQFTYQALLDAIFSANNNMIDISGTEWGRERQDKVVRLSPEDQVYQEIRDLHIDQLGPLLQEKTKAMQQLRSEKDAAKSVAELQQYAQKLVVAEKIKQSLDIHINLAGELKSTIQSKDYRTLLRLEDEITAQSSSTSLDSLEDLVDDQQPFHEVMRLLCLYSLANNGVKAKQLDQLKRYILQSYGIEHLLTLCNMERVGLLRYQQGKSVWSGIKRHFNLLVEDSAAERDISYAYSGYAPLSVRLVQNTRSLPKGWRSCQDALNLLYGPAQELQQPLGPGMVERDHATPSVVLVCFVGGATYGEIAALRRLSELEDGQRKFLVLTTEFLNAKKFFDSLRSEQVFKQAPLESSRTRPQEQKSFWRR